MTLLFSWSRKDLCGEKSQQESLSGGSWNRGRLGVAHKSLTDPTRKRSYTSAKSSTSRLDHRQCSWLRRLREGLVLLVTHGQNGILERLCRAWASPRSRLFHLSSEEPFTQCWNWYESGLESVTVPANPLRIGSVCLRCGRRRRTLLQRTYQAAQVRRLK